MEAMKNTISAIIIAKNEELRIGECIKSLDWVSEIILVDNNSTDRTRDIARSMNVSVVTTSSDDFSEIRNVGLTSAHGDWILYVDADERITPSLARTIQKIMKEYGSSSPNGYYITRKNYYLGHLWPHTDKMHRLFRKDALKGWRGKLHETAVVEGRVETIVDPILHQTHRTLEEMVSKTNEWSKTEAVLRYEAHHPQIVGWRLIRVFLTGFFRMYFSGGGWKAGTVGIIESVYQGFSLFITYAKLWELQVTSHEKNTR